jgi:glucose/arabinose dehydrogenase
MSGLQSPWDMAFLDDGTLFFTEKCRGLSVRSSSGVVTRLFGSAGSALLASDLFCDGQSGMHGVALDPQFSSNRFIYVYMPSSAGPGMKANRVVRLVVGTNLTSVGNRIDIVTGIPLKTAATANGSSGAHSGGRIRFGPGDGLLYVTTGDNHDGPLPQDPQRLGGKVLRVDRDGSAAAANNPPPGFDRRIFTYGHRNPQGIAFRPGSFVPYVAEHGPNHSDEVTALVNGGNGGWDPTNRPSLACPDNYCGYAGNAVTMPMTDIGRFPGAMRPAWSNTGLSQGMGPAEFLSGPQWKAWNGRLLVGIMGANRLDLLELDALGTVTSRSNVGSLPAARFRSLVNAPDGSLYIATDGGEIWRVTPQ